MKKGQFMQSTEFNFYTKVKDEISISSSNVPKGIIRSKDFQALLDAHVISKERAGKGFKYFLKKPEAFERFYFNRYPNPDIEVQNETDNQLKYKDTKASNTDKETIILLRGFQKINANGIEIDISQATEQFNVFSIVLHSLKAKKLCFIENMESFLNAEKLLGKDYVYIHFYGRLPSIDKLSKIKCDEYLHFGDYDFTGLSEFTKAEKVFKNSKLYVPDDFDDMFHKYARKRKAKDVLYSSVANSENPIVIKIRELVKETGKFLEQQVLFEGKL